MTTLMPPAEYARRMGLPPAELATLIRRGLVTTKGDAVMVENSDFSLRWRFNLAPWPARPALPGDFDAAEG